MATPFVSFFHNLVLLERNTAMDITFTTEQSLHAMKVAAELFKKRRFFLPRGVSTTKPLPYLSPKVFEHIYRLNDLFEDEYFFTAKTAEAKLRKLELDHGINAPKLKDSQAVAECNRYTGGLDIVAIVPLEPLFPSNLETPAKIAEELVDLNYPSSDKSNTTPNVLLSRQALYEEYAQGLERDCSLMADRSEKVLVVLETRFNPSSSQGDFMLGKLDGLVTAPYLTSEVLFRLARQGIRLSDLGFTVFTSSINGHISLVCVPDYQELVPDQKSGYDCTIAFATIL